MFKRIGFVTLILLMSLASVSYAVEVTCLEDSFTRGSGQPITEYRTFPGVAGPAILKIYNGADDDPYEKVSSSIISINEIEITNPDSFNQNVEYLEIPITLVEGENNLAVQIRSKPGCRVAVVISQFVDAQIILPEGGEIQGEDNIVLIVPSGATDNPVTVTITALQEVDLGTPIPSSTIFLGGVDIDLGVNQLNDNLDISMPAPAGVPDGAEVYLTKLVEYAGQTMFQLVDTAIVEGGIITSQDPAFPGVINSGYYSFLWTQDMGSIEGQVTTNGTAVTGAIVTLSGAYWVDTTDGDGVYFLPGSVGNFVVNAFDPLTGEHGEQQGFMPYSGGSVIVNVQIDQNLGIVLENLTNGDFETGDFSGWELIGAGSVTGGFGPIIPQEGNFMAMITTGEGAVNGTSSGLEQSFTVPSDASSLTLHYNFVSDEYPEYVGSIFNDIFNITLHTPQGSSPIAVNSVNTANFTPVSIGGTAWGQTGWLPASIDVAAWAGTDDTLTITVHDVGDTAVDSVVLVDGINFGESNLISEETVSDTVSLNEWKYYTINTSSSDTQISFDLTHLIGDIDLYVRKGEKPTLTESDCKPFLAKDGNYFKSETCVQDNSDDNVWYVGVHGSEAGSYKLKAIIGNVAGWASETGFKKADTEIREDIVDLATAAVGSASGQSVVCTGSNCWLTDIAGGDGALMRNAITVYHNWRETTPVGPIDQPTRISMIAQFAGSNYTYAQMEMLVDQIIIQYSGTVPTTENETLTYMNIQRQCLEWAMFIAEQAGGARVNYGGSGAYTVASETIRPGMGFYDLNYHAMIIVDVRYDTDGNPDRVHVAESNYDSGWIQNPAGQIPWERTIENDRNNVGLGHASINYDH